MLGTGCSARCRFARSAVLQNCVFRSRYDAALESCATFALRLLREKENPASSQRTAPTPGLWIQVMSAFRIGPAGFAFRLGCVACGTIPAGRFATLGARRTFGTRTFTGSIAARGTFGTRAITRLLAIARLVGFTARFAVTRTLGIAGLLAIAGPVCFTAGFAVTRLICIAGLLTIAGPVGFAAGLAVTRSAWRRSEAARAFTFTGSAGRRAEIAAGSAFALHVWRRARRAVAGSAHALRWRRHQFVHRQFAVVIPVELAQRLGRAGDFVLGDDSVAVLVERGDDGRYRWHRAGTGAAGRTVELRAAFAGRRRSRRRAFRWLCERKTRRQGERERDDGCAVFHGLVLVRLFVLLFFVSDCRGSGGEESTRTDAGSGSFIEGYNHAAIKRVCAIPRKIVKEV